MKKSLAIAAAVVAGLLILGCGSSSGSVEKGKVTTTGAPQPAQSEANNIATGKIGDTITYTSTQMTVDITVADQSMWTCSDGCDNPKNPTYKITVLVKSGKYSANPNYFVFVTPDGVRYTYNWFGKTPILDSADLVSGQKLSGYLSFDVPANILVGSQVELLGGDFSASTIGIWKLP